MTKDTQEKLKKILSLARHDVKGDFRIYHMYRRQIEDLALSPKEFETAIRSLSNALEI